MINGLDDGGAIVKLIILSYRNFNLPKFLELNGETLDFSLPPGNHSMERQFASNNIRVVNPSQPSPETS